MLEPKLSFSPTRNQGAGEKSMVTCQMRDIYDCMTFYSPVFSSVEPVLSEWSKENRNSTVGGHMREQWGLTTGCRG